MAQAGLFDDADVILHWHPYDRNHASPIIASAAIEAKFQFRSTGLMEVPV
jgi:aminobenzoyl-glutamate utilization protein B